MGYGRSRIRRDGRIEPASGGRQFSPLLSPDPRDRYLHRHGCAAGQGGARAVRERRANVEGDRIERAGHSGAPPAATACCCCPIWAPGITWTSSRAGRDVDRLYADALGALVDHADCRGGAAARALPPYDRDPPDARNGADAGMVLRPPSRTASGRRRARACSNRLFDAPRGIALDAAGDASCIGIIIRAICW